MEYFSTNGKEKIFTISFTGSTAESFFARLQKSGVRKVIDTRLWADTQLSGFAKKKDLGFLLKNLVGVNYEHKIDLAPTEEILKDYKEKRIAWPEYEPCQGLVICGGNVG